MIIVKMQGGLGNQMFQMCSLDYLKQYDPCVVADVSEYNGTSYHHGLEIEKVFTQSLKYAKQKDIFSTIGRIQVRHNTKIGNFVNILLKKLSRSCEKKARDEKRLIYVSDFVKYDNNEITRIFEDKKRIYIDGFWQYKKVYDYRNPQEIFHFRSEVIEKCIDYLDIMKNNTTCSIHIRCGDFVGTDNDNLKDGYYKKAINIIKNSFEDVLFLVFSDDIEEAKKRIGILSNACYVTDIESAHSGCDLYLMTQCNHNIIANSTYSFWGAKLNRHKDKIIIAPRWMRKGVSFINPEDEDWILL